MDPIGCSPGSQRRVLDGGFFTEDCLLYLEGRVGEMIKSGGANVTPSEVESLLMSFAEVKEAYLAGVADAQRGENVAAAVVLEPRTPVAAEEIRTRAKAELAV